MPFPLQLGRKNGGNATEMAFPDGLPPGVCGICGKLPKRSSGSWRVIDNAPGSEMSASRFDVDFESIREAATKTSFGVPKACQGCRAEVNKRTGHSPSGRKAKKSKIIEEVDVSAACPRCQSETAPTSFRFWQPVFSKAMNEVPGCYDRACSSCVSVARKAYRPSILRESASTAACTETRGFSAQIFMDQIAQLKSDMAVLKGMVDDERGRRQAYEKALGFANASKQISELKGTAYKTR